MKLLYNKHTKKITKIFNDEDYKIETIINTDALSDFNNYVEMYNRHIQEHMRLMAIPKVWPVIKEPLD